jgi:hypothetical protein
VVSWMQGSSLCVAVFANSGAVLCDGSSQRGGFIRPGAPCMRTMRHEGAV